MIWLDICWLPVEGKYSPTLGRAFVSGHRPTFWGRASLVSYEMMADEMEILPEQLQGAGFMAELPRLSGALFKGTSGEALFYDGVTVVDLFSNYPTPFAKNSWEKWGVSSTQNPERTFLRQIISFSETPVVAELKDRPQLIPISVPKELAKTWLSLFTLSDDPRLWGVTRHSLLAEVEGDLRTVVTVLEPYVIEEFPGTPRISGSAIPFVLRNKDTDAATDYFLRHASPSAQCKITLNPDEPISLDKE